MSQQPWSVRCAQTTPLILTLYPQFKKHLAFRKRREGDAEDLGDGRHRVADGSNETLAPADGAPSSRYGSLLSRHSHSRSRSRQPLSSDSAPALKENGAHPRDAPGLHVLHRPAGAQRHVDVVFVHGLGGSSRGTWTKDRDLARCWPSEFLPLEPGIGSDARILTFGYNSKFRSGAGKSQMSMLDFAKDLLYEMRYAHDDSDPEGGGLGMGEASRRIACITPRPRLMRLEPHHLCRPLHGGLDCQRGVPARAE